ncbi:hypothetical protein N7466_006526 [Penicillium verhagenii]|uniref:uncharacterized protein n=1 Tax=Penicillium verhagenii TaxID=1562060 RepID=UPI0025459C07|nr:uncharacterized protein N7466_006526 [Penicillium verhagenii]KAJ5931033.1 hypothetical protein N7466_006526 [Penicillium verhagenii]
MLPCPSPDLESSRLLEHAQNDAYLTQVPLDTIPPGSVLGRSHWNESSSTVLSTISNPLDTTSDDHLLEDKLPRFAAIEFLRQWLPEVHPEDPGSNTLLRKFSNRDVALIVHQSVAGLVLIFNIIVTSLAIHSYVPMKGIGGIVDVPGVTNCDDVHSYNMGIHFAINVLSTILLGSSNYCSQLLVAPTRKDIEKAHKTRKTLDIGIQSFRNLRAVDTPRRVLWVLLMISSGLLHLFWNTVVFAASPKVSYNVGVVTSDYLEDTTPWNYSMPGIDQIRRNATHLTPLSRADCIERYTNSDNGLSDVLLVARNVSKYDQLSFAIDNSSSLLSNFSAFETASHENGSIGVDWTEADSWVCSAWAPLGYYALPPDSQRVTVCTASAMTAYVDSWTFTRWQETPAAPSGAQLWAGVDHCIPASGLYPMENKCQLRVSYALLIIVCGLNLIKLLCIFGTARLHHSGRLSTRHEGDTKAKTAYLVTVGDAIASFLEHEDDHTKNLSLVTQSDFSRGKWPDEEREHKEFDPGAKLRVRRWFSSVTILQWISTLLL